jgi:DNA-binding NtrC family response regulator
VGQALRGLHGGRGRAVLIIEPSPDQQSRLARQVTVHGHRVIGTSSLDGALALLRAFPVDLVLISEALLGADPVRLVGELVSSRPNSRVVVMATPAPSEPPLAGDSGVRPARHGALEYVSRPVTSDTLTMLLAG